MTQIPGRVYYPKIAILTALPNEFAAVRTLLDHPVSHTEYDHRGTRHYMFGTMPSRSGGRHQLVLHRVGVGNSISAAATTQLLNDLPSVRTIILSGIAGGAPNPFRVAEHVRLGDIVVSGEQGIIQYDFIKEEPTSATPRHPPRAASSNLVRAARTLEAESISGSRPWESFIDTALTKLVWKRPPEPTDVLASSEDASIFLEHPEDPIRIAQMPRVFIGPIASANTLLKNPRRRDALRDQYGVKAIEMEASGTADAAWMTLADHFVIRGICDYCDTHKGDDWQNYAAAAAAGYLKSILGMIGEIQESTHVRSTQSSAARPEGALSKGAHTDATQPDDDTAHQVDEARGHLHTMLSDNGSENARLVPILSWINSIDRKFHSHRLLNREALALASVYAELQRVPRRYAGLQVPPAQRFSLDLLERYQDSSVLRTNWEARCAIGNALTGIVSESRGDVPAIINQAVQASGSEGNWDLAQMLFDALHHGALTTAGREFIMGIAVAHGHKQVRWNVAAALKSVQLSSGDLSHVLAQLLCDPSAWVLKELIDVALGNERVLTGLSRAENAARLLESLHQHPVLVEHVSMSLRSIGQHHSNLVSHSLPEIARDLASHPPLGDHLRPIPAGSHSWEILSEDFRNVEHTKRRLRSQHGKLYKAAERVALGRIQSGDPEHQRDAITTYLRSTHDALAWASVRALFSGALDRCSDDGYIENTVSDMLTHSSEWIRRECVEETLRLNDGRVKYLALRQIEKQKRDLWRLDEVRPYLIEIGLRIAA